MNSMNRPETLPKALRISVERATAIVVADGVDPAGPIIDITDALYGWAREHGYDEDDSAEFAMTFDSEVASPMSAAVTTTDAQRLCAILAAVDQLSDALRASYQAKHGHLARYDEADYVQPLTCEVGGKFIRLVITLGGQRSVHAFVDKSNGDLLKSAGWKAPAKGARGNLLTGLDEVLARADWSGGYLYAR